MSATTYRQLDPEQQRLLDEVDAAAGGNSARKVQRLLAASDAPGWVRAGVADVMIGDGAGNEFRS